MEFTFNGVIPEDITFNGNYLERVKCNGVTVWEKYHPTPYTECLCFGIPSNGIEIQFGQWYNSTINNITSGGPDLKYKVNDGAWTKWDFINNPTLTFNKGEQVYFKGNNPGGFTKSENKSAPYVFHVSGGETADRSRRFTISGNIMSLIDDGKCRTTKIPSDYCFSHLFYKWRWQHGYEIEWLGETDISGLKLPATTLTAHCYDSMFYNAWLIGGAFDELPAKTLTDSCYYMMFASNGNLTSAPVISATKLASYCCHHMFDGCYKLKIVYPLLALTCAYECYSYMFQDCKALVTAPEIRATTLAGHCMDSMFIGCSNLVTGPELFATVPNSAQDAYINMFRGCPKITSVICHLLEDPWYCTQNWLQDTSTYGAIYVDSTMVSGYSWNKPNTWAIYAIH